MDKVKFHSEHDIACGWELDKVIERVNDNSIDKEWSINDVIEFYNIFKYIQVIQFAEYIQEKTGFVCVDYSQKIKKKIGQYLGINNDNIIEKFDELDFVDTEDYLEILEKYSIYKTISELDFKSFLDKEHVHVYLVLKHKKIVDSFDSVLRYEILSDSINAETIISKYLDESNLYLPLSLLESDKLNLIDDYIDSLRVNINVLRKIIYFPTGKGLNITDKIRLHAKRKEKEESERIFSEGTGIETGVSIRYVTDIEGAIQFSRKGRTLEIVVNRNWIEENLDYPTLWNNFIHLFNIVDNHCRLTMASKTNDMSAIEAVIRPSGSHLYSVSDSFFHREMTASIKVNSYIRILNVLNIRIEDMIEWFFNDYLHTEFSISNFIVKMPTEVSSYFEKCRTILPEIDRIFKQYNTLIEDGEIDQELIQISSSSTKIKDIKSFISCKYAYPINEWYQSATFLLFSDQSSIFYIPSKDEKYKNFMDLIINDNVAKKEFQEYQLNRMEWLFENSLILENEDGYIKIADANLIYILTQLYYEDVLNYWHLPHELRRVIDDLELKEIVTIEGTLLTRNEHDYFDYYLNKSKFTNGYDLRNRYLHGTNVNDEKQYESDYYSILKLFIIIILKINDDLCLSDDNNKALIRKIKEEFDVKR